MASKYPPDATVRLVTKANTASADYIDFTGTANSTLASASYAEVTASTAAQYYVTGLAYKGANNGSGAAYRIRCEVGIGGSGSETSIAKSVIGVVGSSATTYSAGDFVFPVPLRVSAGTRIAVRVEDPAGAASYAASLLVVAYSSVEGN